MVHAATKKKVNCTLVHSLRSCTGRTAHRVSRGIAILFHDHGTRKGWGFSVTPWPLFTPGNDPVTVIQEAGWAPGPVWTRAENLAHTGFDPRTVQPVASHYTDWATRRSHSVVSINGSEKFLRFPQYCSSYLTPPPCLLSSLFDTFVIGCDSRVIFRLFQRHITCSTEYNATVWPQKYVQETGRCQIHGTEESQERRRSEKSISGLSYGILRSWMWNWIIRHSVL
jgi:hypothetical protein